MLIITMELKKFNMICAADEKLGIGKNQKLPWKLPSEYAFFQHQATFRHDESKKNAAIMGRNNWFANPHNREDSRLCYIVVSKTLREPPPGAHYVCDSVASAIKLVSSQVLADTIENVWIWGGHGVYKEGMSLPQCHRIYLTRIHAEFDCDAFFPQLDTVHYRKVSDPEVSEETQKENGIEYKFKIYKRFLEDS